MSVRESDVHSLLRGLPPSSFMYRYIEYAMNITDCNMAFHIAGGLSVLSTTVPYGDRGLQADFGGLVIPNLFSLLYGNSTESRKTTAVKIARRLVYRINKNAVGCEPGSQEGLVESIRDNRRQTIFYTEFGDFLKKTSGNSYMSTMKLTMNNVADGVSLGRALGGVNTKKKNAEAVDNYLVSLLGGVAPPLLEAHADWEDWTGGFLGRFLLIDAARERYFPQPGSAPDVELDLLKWLALRLKNQAVGNYLGFDDAAKALWWQFSFDVENIKSRVAADVLSSLARSQQIAMKIAMLLSWDYGQAFGGGNWQITAAEMGPALAIARMHVKSAISIGSTLASSHDMRDRRKVLTLVDPNKPKTLGEIIKGSQMLKKRVMDLIGTLAEEGSIVTYAIGEGGRAVQGWKRMCLLPSEEATMIGPADLIGTGRLQAHLDEMDKRQAAERLAILSGNAGSMSNVIPITKATGIAPAIETQSVKIETNSPKIEQQVEEPREPRETEGTLPDFDPSALKI